MMESLKIYQNSRNIWNQLIDQDDCWSETSGSAMFAFAFIKGVKNGWLDEKEYAPLARKAWMSLVTYINEQGDVTEICIGTDRKTISSITTIVNVVLGIIMDSWHIFGV